MKKNVTDDGPGYLHYFIISIMLSAVLTSVMPTIGFILYGAGEEKSLNAKARQIYLAEELAQHREYVNKKVANSKLEVINNEPGKFNDKPFIDSLKFSQDKGLYLKRNYLTLGNVRILIKNICLPILIFLDKLRNIFFCLQSMQIISV